MAFAELTEAGHEKFRAARRTHREGVRRFFLKRIDHSDQRALRDVWTRFLEQEGP